MIPTAIRNAEWKLCVVTPVRTGSWRDARIGLTPLFNPLEWQFSLNWQATLFAGLGNNKLSSNNPKRTVRERQPFGLFVPPPLPSFHVGERGQISVFRLPRSWFPSSFLAQSPQLSAVYHEGLDSSSLLYIGAKSSSRRLLGLFEESFLRRTIRRRERQRERERERGFLWQQDNGQSKR